MRAELATLRNSVGQALYCQLHLPTPEVARKQVACLMLSPGVKMRVAPHRMYRKLMSVFLSRGIAVLRVDFHGLGDSEGELPEVQIDQLYRKVQQGRHVDDVQSAMTWLERRLGICNFIVGGLCGGAITGLLAAEVDPRVVALYAVGIPVTLDGPAEQSSRHMTQSELKMMRRAYVRKLLHPSSWVRVLTLRSDFALMRRALLAAVRARVRRVHVGSSERGTTPEPASSPAANLNPAFPRAFFRLLERRAPVLLLFSGADRLYAEYLEKFDEPWAAPLAPYRPSINLHVIEKANHVLGDPSWIAQANLYTEEWLDARFR